MIKYKSKALEAIHELSESLYEIGTINQETMEHFDRACLEHDYALIDKPTVTGVPWEPQPSEDVTTKGYIESLMPQEYKNHVKKIEAKYNKLKLNMEVRKKSHTMTIGHLLDILENLSKDTKILDVSKITYIMHKDGEIAVRFE